MRCECCDVVLSPSEDSAMFVEADGRKPYRRVGMCSDCRGYLPQEVKYVTKRTKVPAQVNTEPEIKDPFDLANYDEDERWD